MEPMLFQEDSERLATGAKFTVDEVVDDYMTLYDEKGNLWSVMGGWQLISRRE